MYISVYLHYKLTLVIYNSTRNETSTTPFFMSVEFEKNFSTGSRIALFFA